MSPLSSDPVKRQAQLANLRGAPPGAQRALSHGGYAQVAETRFEKRLAERVTEFAEQVPTRLDDGSVPASHFAMLVLLARCDCRLEDIERHLDTHGAFEQRGKRKGQLREAVLDRAERLRREQALYLGKLGMSAKDEAALGLTEARLDLATAMSDGDTDVLRRVGVLDAEASDA